MTKESTPKETTIIHGDCLEKLKELPDNSVDSIVTDPPYGLSFMGKKWDYDVPSEDIWRECFRVLKHGGHLLSFAGTRTQHRMAVRIEDAGFEIRDMIAWVYGSGFPKSHNLKDEWQGWGTALKPALEPITVARKPLIGTVAANVLEHGTGALNIDGCRVEFTNDADKESAKPSGKATAKSGALAGKAQDGFVILGAVDDGQQLYWIQDFGWGNGRDEATVYYNWEIPKLDGEIKREPAIQRKEFFSVQGSGRWPANLIHDGSDEVVAGFPVTAPSSGAKRVHKANNSIGTFGTSDRITQGVADAGGSASRFFYCAKASKKDRDEGLEGFESKRGTVGNKWTDQDYRRGDEAPSVDRQNHHPTVKPTDLMRYLCRLVTPPNGIVLDPFMGSGSTGKAARLEGFNFIGIEREAEYVEIAKARIDAAIKVDLFT